MTTILSLMRVPEHERDLAWLRRSLQSAIELEHATLPLYLTSLWSIKDHSSCAAKILRSVALEEMSHMGLACNLLTTIGGVPRIDDPAFVPTYPGPLPGHINPDLVLCLQRLTVDAAAQYMEVERPSPSGEASADSGGEYPTIGAFYGAVQAHFDRLDPECFTGDHQQISAVGHGVFAINSLADATAAITLIKDEGEGASYTPYDGEGHEFAHFYKFGEIRYGRSLIRVGGGWEFEGDPIPMPETWPMATIPHGGYPDVSIDFDRAYTKLLRDLHAAWRPGGNIATAVDSMFRLEELARALMQTEIPGHGGATYGPSWRYVA